MISCIINRLAAMFLIRSASDHGCYFDNIFIGCMIYADGFLLLSGSLCDLQAMVAFVGKNWKR